jgi:hypothetical protein
MNNVRFFITGIPTAGKSYLAKRIAAETGGIAICLDNFRSELASDERYRRWVNFYRDQDEATYYMKHTADERWQCLVAQSEALWPAFLEKIASYQKESRTLIFESVNILPHLARRNLHFPGVVLSGSSYEATLERNQKEPRWGATKELQELEAKEFFYDERARYRGEAEKYGYPVFGTPEEALPMIRTILNGG